MYDQPLDIDELELLEDIIVRHSDDHSIINLAELDGYLTALVSGPQVIDPSVWFPAMWDGRELDWESPDQFKQFFELLIRHLNSIAETLTQEPEHFQAMFEQVEFGDGFVDAPEEWCFGYMRGVALGNWPALPAEQAALMQIISDHSLAEDHLGTEAATAPQPVAGVELIDPAVRALHAYWLAQRLPQATAPYVADPKAGRNDPCPCGSGKKFKQCCLH